MPSPSKWIPTIDFLWELREETVLLGKLVVFDRNSDLNFTKSFEVTPPAEFQQINMQFGASSTFLDDLLIVGAPNDDDFAGSVYLFQKELNGSYSFLEKVVDENPQDGDLFGYKLKLSDSWLATSSLQITLENRKVSIFEIEPDNSITYHTEIFASDASTGDEFGFDLSMNENWLVVGAPKSSSQENGEDSELHIFITGMQQVVNGLRVKNSLRKVYLLTINLELLLKF